MTFPPRQRFRQWLQSRPPTEVIAKGYGCTTCPLANWLAQSENAPSPYISPANSDGFGAVYHIEYGGDEPCHLMPAWANEFALQVDSIFDRDAPHAIWRDHAVTAAQCLAILDQIPDTKDV